MEPIDYLNAARVPQSVKPQRFGDWRITRGALPEKVAGNTGWKDYTVLCHKTYPKLDCSNIHLADDDGMVWDVVMEDSPGELRRHLPAWLGAYGRVLITGLGLGCVVRGLLASPRVQHIDVVEVDAGILRIIGGEFRHNPRVTLHHSDALKFPKKSEWDFAWHDIWTPGNVGLAAEHAKLIKRFSKRANRQGAWAFPRELKRISRIYGLDMVG